MSETNIDAASATEELFRMADILNSRDAHRPGKQRCACGNRDDRIIAGYAKCEECMEEGRIKDEK